MCLHWTEVRLRSLQGGFSGSLLLLAEGYKGSALTEPMVIKIDNSKQMRREINGYHRVKDFCGKHVPTFSCPVVLDSTIGVGMELAAMQGEPQTLQDQFEQAEDEQSVSKFLKLLSKVIAELSNKLYRNTSFLSTVVPYREFVLHTRDQIDWLGENATIILEYAEATNIKGLNLDPSELQGILRVIATNEDGMQSQICLAHGDLNYKNIICDHSNNIWFIDWTHAGDHPVEIDFAKLENDIKFVMSKDFDQDDLPRLKRFEEYLIAHRMPAEPSNLPEELRFVKWDLRYRKILTGIIQIRSACFALKQTDDWLIYQIALLKYALHTLSFDERRNNGECDLIQLLYALFSTEALVYKLVMDDFHLRIRGERPLSYPPRQRISIDESIWIFDCPDYAPEYHVDTDVLANDYTQKQGGWADPEAFELLVEKIIQGASKYKDDSGRPLNPRGRTGLSGRGLLGRWGVNQAVGVISTRINPTTHSIDILLGRRENQTGLSIPRGFVLNGESPDHAMSRILETKTGRRANFSDADVINEGYYYDARQTDHAWIELRAYIEEPESEFDSGPFRPTDAFEELEWLPMTPETINNIGAAAARLVHEAITRLIEKGAIDEKMAKEIFAAIG